MGNEYLILKSKPPCMNSQDSDLRPVSQKSRNFTGYFRVSQFPLYLKNGKDLSRQTPQSVRFLLSSKHVKRSAFLDKRLVGSQMAFRARKVFEKRAPGNIRSITLSLNHQGPVARKPINLIHDSFHVFDFLVKISFAYFCFSRLTSYNVNFCRILALNSIWEYRNKLLG